MTLTLFAGGAALAVCIALTLGMARMSASRCVRLSALCFIEFFRGTSALVQLFWVYFALPLVGVDLGPIVSGVLVLGLNSGAYGAELVRGAVESVPRGQWEAAVALNLPKGTTLRRIILPQAAVMMIPPGANLLVELLKNTSLASLITLSELAFEAQVLRASTLRTMEIYGVVLILYFVMARTITVSMKALESRFRWGLRPVEAR